MTQYLALLLLAHGSNAMAIPRQQPVPAPPRSQAPTLPKTIKVPTIPASTSGGDPPSQQQQQQQQTPSAATVTPPSTIEAKTPKLPTVDGNAPPPAKLPPDKDPKPTVLQNGGGGDDVPSVTNQITATAAPTFLLNDKPTANNDEENQTPTQSTANSLPTTPSPTFYPSDWLSNSPTPARSSRTYPPTHSSSENLFVPSPTALPTDAVVLSSDAQISPSNTHADSGENGTDSSVYLSDASTHYTIVADEINGDAAQDGQNDFVMEYGLISISIGFVLSSVVLLGVIRRRATARKKSEELSATLGDGSVL